MKNCSSLVPLNYVRLLTLGHDLIRSNPKYHLLKNNCQVWVEKFLAKVCPSAEVEKILAEVLQGSSK